MKQEEKLQTSQNTFGSNRGKNSLIRLSQAAIMAALCFVTFTFLGIKIPLPGGEAVSIHLANGVVVIAALLLGGRLGGLAGAIGLSISDILDPVYITGAPKTFILKLCIGLIAGYVAHHIGKIDETTDRGHIFKWTAIASACGLGFNVIADPVFGYFYKMYILGQPQQVAQIVAKWSSGVTLLNAVVSLVLAVAVYQAIRPALSKMGVLRLQPASK